METFFYQFTLHKYLDSTFIDGSNIRLNSRYVVKTERNLRQDEVCLIASKLVMAERVLSHLGVRFGRVVVLPLAEGKPFDIERETFNAVPFSVPGYSDYAPLSGLRGGTFLLPFGQCSAHVNRVLGRAWTKWFPFAAGKDDCELNRLKGDKLGVVRLNDSGPFSSLCLPFAAHVLEQMPGLCFDADLKDFGVLEVTPKAVDNKFVRGHCSYFLNLHRYFYSLPLGERRLNCLFAHVDTSISQCLESYLKAMNNFVWESAETPPDVEPALKLANFIAGTWRVFAFWLGYTIPAGSRWVDGIDDYLQDDEGTAPRPVQLRANKEEVFKLVNRLYILHHWLNREMQFSGNWNQVWDWKENFGGTHYGNRKVPHAQSIYTRFDEITRFIFDVIDCFNLLQELVRIEYKRDWVEYAKGAHIPRPVRYSDELPTMPRNIEMWVYHSVLPIERGPYLPDIYTVPPPNEVAIRIPQPVPQNTNVVTVAPTPETPGQRLKRLIDVEDDATPEFKRDLDRMKRLVKKQTGKDYYDYAAEGGLSI